MLTKKEELKIRNNAHNYYHVVECNAHVFGEPFLEDGYLYYYDGFVITIISQRLEGVSDQDNLNGIVAYVAKKHDPENIILWGEMPNVDILNQKGYKLSSEKLEPWRRELVIHANDFQPSKKYKKYLKKAKEENLKLNFVDSKYYKEEHLRLLFNTHKNQSLGIKSLSYYCVYPNLEKTRLVEVLKGDKIVSINIIIDDSPQYVCFAEIGYDSEIKNISGLSKALLFEYYIDKTKFISWGGCANEGIFDFKKEFIGETPFCFYDNYERHQFYKKDKKSWWIDRLSE